MNKALSPAFTLSLLVCIGLGVYKTFSVQRETDYYQQQIDSITQSLETEPPGDQSRLWVRSLNTGHQRAAAQYYLPPNKPFTMAVRDLAEDAKPDRILLKIPAAKQAREGFLYIEVNPSKSSGDSIRIAGLSDRPLTIAIRQDRKLVEHQHLLKVLPKAPKQFKEAIERQGSVAAYGGWSWYGNEPSNQAQQIYSYDLMALLTWRSELRVTTSLDDAEQMLVLYETSTKSSQAHDTSQQ